MASSFGAVDLTTVIKSTGDGAIPLPDTNDSVIRTPLAYGGESVQDSNYDLSTFSYDLDFPTYAAYLSFRALKGDAATLTIDGTAFTNTSLNQISNVARYPDGQTVCSARFTRKGL